MNGQALSKTAVSDNDYHLWGTLYTDRISDQGQWVSYVMRYDEHPDTLFVSKTDGKKKYKFANAQAGLFSGESYFGFRDDSSDLQVVNLETGMRMKYPDVANFSFSEEGDYLISLIKNQGLEIRNAKGALIDRIAGVKTYKQNYSGNALICSGSQDGRGFVLLLDLKGTFSKNEILNEDDVEITRAVWDYNDRSFAFLAKGVNDEGSTPYFYSLKDEQLRRFDIINHSNFPPNYFPENGPSNGLVIGADGCTVLFRIRKDKTIAKTFDGVQVWNGNDAVPYSNKMFFADGEANVFMAAWWPFENKFQQITDEDRPTGVLNGSQEFALTYSLNDLPPQYNIMMNVNYYLSSIETGDKVLLLENQSLSESQSTFSPTGRFFAYYREAEWWIYDFTTKQHTNISKSTPVEKTSVDKNVPLYTTIGGWGPEDNFLLVYDQYDIWKISVAGKAPVRLTNGRESGISYRIVPTRESIYSKSDFRGNVVPPVELDQVVLLTGSKGNMTGYFILKPNGAIEKLLFEDSLNNHILKAKKADIFVFQSQRYDSPPKIIVSSSGQKKTTKVFQSNPQHFKYKWGQQEIIQYQADKGNLKLTGILYYPADYVKGKKYPMVVNVYEMQSYLQHYYFNPSKYKMAGFNVANLTAEGYFVFLPDIEYKLGEPAISATDCVVEATKEVLKKGIVLEDKIGLVGHSFGGYEVNYIITQTNLFACAISGSSVADLPGWYLSIGWVNGKPEIWRSESQQWRMGKSLFEDRQAYSQNSPVTFVDQVETPLLLWSGENDRQIHYYQSIAYYLALRRLNKKNIMLLYPGEGHVLLSKPNQQDLWRRMKDWFAYFLKDQKTRWISDGIK